MHLAGDICCTAVAAVQCSPMDCGCSATYCLCIAAGTTCWANNRIVTEDEGDISPLPGEIMEKHQEPHKTGEDEVKFQGGKRWLREKLQVTLRIPL